MEKRKKGYGILLTGTIVSTILGIVTLIPSEYASKASMLGYKAVCSFTPISTILCFMLAGLCCITRKRLFVEPD